ncbi:MAG: 6-aminohexanoate hydrolase [Gammaproteobacteria bacterium]|jgi:hypothetical protein|nr:6-aminohexanoate hydrolase [Gammaproteobacteria bacterium]|tara:strand:+ start:1558 stop:2718 length:1161 start_codon:yes stop_codon:yes gene_type:complete
MSIELVSTENWGDPPHNRWSFQHVQALFPTARVRRGTGPASEFTERHEELTQLTYQGLDDQPRSVRQMLDETYTDAFLVMKDGVILTEEYGNDMSADSHHLLNSVTKSFVGMLTGILVKEGVINPDKRVAGYIPEFEETAFRETTLQQALDMTAAVKFGEDYADKKADFWVEAAVVGWRPALVHDHSASTLFDYALSLKETEQSDGEKFHYRTVLTNVVAMVIERTTGQKIQNLLEQRLWQKLGTEQDACIVVDPAGFPYVGAGMSACARDLARFGQMLLQNGHYNGSQIVPAEWIANTLVGNDELRKLFSETDYAAMLPGGHYRNQVWVNPTQKVMMCIGIYGQTIFVDQSTGVVMVKLSTHPEPVDDFLFGDTFLAMNTLSAAL